MICRPCMHAACQTKCSDGGGLTTSVMHLCAVSCGGVATAHIPDQTQQPHLAPASSGCRHISLQAAHMLRLLSGVVVRMLSSKEAFCESVTGCMTQLSQAVQQILLTDDCMCSTSTAPQAIAQSARERSPE